MTTNRRIVLHKRPQGVPADTDFELQSIAVPELKERELLVRNQFLSIDPAIRGWLDARADSYQPPVGLGEVVRAVTVGRVEASRNAAFAPGDTVFGLHGWEEYSISNGVGLVAKIDPGLGFDLPLYLSVLGTTGLTAYFGLLAVGQPRDGDTVLVSAAAGAVGSVVGQIAKIKGCRTVGIAGGPQKCRQLVGEFGFDAAIDYRNEPDLTAAIRRACPNGINVYFDNVGGDILEAALANLAIGARVVMCGAISGYNATTPVPGPANLWQLLVRSARMEGFLFSNYAAQFPAALQELAGWVVDGRLKHREHFVDGLERTVAAFRSLFDGTNTGKLIVRL